jgi:murein DD-endopeptidase MepM/ murein hydrolase activator NlpD
MSRESVAVRRTRVVVALVLAVALSATMLALPRTAPAAAAAAPPSFHVVRPGDTLKAIAKRYGVSVTNLGAWNGIPKPYRLYVDSVLRFGRPTSRFPAFRTVIHVVTPLMINWNPAKGCPVAPANLRKIWVSYIDFNGNYHDGNIIVHKDHAVRTQKVFQRLYYSRFRIQAMSPIDVNAPNLTDYAAVTGGFTCRKVGGSMTWSQHAYGTAIDINPVQNPMIRDGVASPAGAAGYVSRGAHRRGMLHADGAVTAFTSNGFFWGGRWHTLKDYMHFSTTNR